MAGVAGLAGGAAADQPARLIDKAEYLNRLRGLWLAEVVANWTGLKAEGRCSAPPFLTDADWNTHPFPDAPGIRLDFVLNQDPWQADDDTDIEAVYLHLLTQHAPAIVLSPTQVRDGWIEHCNGAIWVSNAAARALMSYPGAGGQMLGAFPPATAFAQGMVGPHYADQSLMIDAQLTTELLGALAPGMPGVALEMADLPIRTTATGYAAHAAQFYVALYALAPLVDRSLPAEAQALWLVEQARRFIPDASKSADVIDFVVADFLANPDHDDWERTRDGVYERYQLNAAANGFHYRAWYESSVNLATGVIALLYGRMDLPRTIRIGTLSGWDCDNGTATMGGLLGLVLGYDGVVAAFDGLWPPGGPADRFWLGRTRSNVPDHLPDDPAADDALSLMAARCMPIVEHAVLSAGGLASPTHWLLPPLPALSPEAALLHSPTHRDHLRSANAQAAATGAPAVGSMSVPGATSHWTYGTGFGWAMTDAQETNWRGMEILPFTHGYASTQRPVSAGPQPQVQSFTVTYAAPITVAAVRFIEGDHFHAETPGAYRGGWFESAHVELLIDGAWVAPENVAPSAPLDALRPFQVVEFAVSPPAAGVTGVRIVGVAGGGPHAGNPDASPFVTCAELDALGPEPVPVRATFDVVADGRVDAEDLYRWCAAPTDLDGDAAAGPGDAEYLRLAVRWTEAATSAGR